MQILINHLVIVADGQISKVRESKAQFLTNIFVRTKYIMWWYDLFHCNLSWSALIALISHKLWLFVPSHPKLNFGAGVTYVPLKNLLQCHNNPSSTIRFFNGKEWFLHFTYELSLQTAVECCICINNPCSY